MKTEASNSFPCQGDPLIFEAKEFYNKPRVLLSQFLLLVSLNLHYFASYRTLKSQLPSQGTMPGLQAQRFLDRNCFWRSVLLLSTVVLVCVQLCAAEKRKMKMLLASFHRHAQTSLGNSYKTAEIFRKPVDTKFLF